MNPITAIISEVLGTVAGMAEAEAKAARRGIVRLLFAVVLLATGLAFLSAVVLLVAVGFFLLLAPEVGATGGAFLTAAILLAFAMAMMLTGRWYAR